MRSDAIERCAPDERLLSGGATGCSRPEADFTCIDLGTRNRTLGPSAKLAIYDSVMSENRYLAAFGLALAALAGPVSAQQTAFDWTIFEPGAWPSQYIGVSMPAAPNVPRLALVARAHRWSLEPAARDWLGANDGVTASLPGTLVFLRHPALQAGPAPTPELKFSGVLRRFEPGTAPLNFAFRSDRYEISLHDRTVWMRQGARGTKIGDLSEADSTGEAYSVDLVWAGDLDRDGRLDVITREQNGAYSVDLCLYLSSPSHPEGELFVKVGCEDWSG